MVSSPFERFHRPNEAFEARHWPVLSHRDLGFNTVLTFFSKLSAGTGEQLLTRQLLRLGRLRK